MNQETTDRVMDLLRGNMGNDVGQTLVMRMLGRMKDGEAEAFASELEDMVQFPDYLSEREAREIVSRFENYDGSRGAHWRDAETLRQAAVAAGCEPEMKGRYNFWAFFATMNMIWSDEWGVLRGYVSSDQEAQVCAELAQSRLMDRDRNFSVRWYFGADEL